MKTSQEVALSWRTEKRKVHELLGCEYNPRKISKEQMDYLKDSLEMFNLVEIPAINADNRIIAGHQRLSALHLLGRGNEEIDVRVPNRKLTKEEYDRYLISSNLITGDWDYDKLQIFEKDFLIDIGFDEIELSKFWSNVLEVKDDNFNEEKELKKIGNPQTKQGDLIILGEHRLICGDCTDPLVLKRLFQDERASMIYSDPPYNIKLDYNKGVGGKKNYGAEVKDDRTLSEYKDFLKKSMGAALSVTETSAHVFYWSDQVYIGVVQELYRELGIDNKRVCLWIKNGHNPTPMIAFNKCYEPCTYGVRGKPHITEDMNNLTEAMNIQTSGNAMYDEIRDIWLTERLAGKEYEHATSKPPKLHENAIKRCSKIGDIILDSFAGSGSTLIAGQCLNRKVYGVEQQPVFCDLIIGRWERLTGKKAEVIRDEKKQTL